MGVILTHMWHIVMGSVAVLDSVLRVGIRNGCRGRKIRGSYEFVKKIKFLIKYAYDTLFLLIYN